MVIVTPVSHLTLTVESLKTISAYGSLEAREKPVPLGFESQVTFFHSEYEISMPWDNSMKTALINKIENFEFLKGVSFHMVSRFKKYKIIDGVAVGIGKPLSEECLMGHARRNIKWLKEVFVDKIIMVENNNDLGTSAYCTVTDPNFISRIVFENDIFFLYDHAHAMISAFSRQIPFLDYFHELPIEKTKQVHLSQPSFKNNIAKDSHNLPTLDQLNFCVENLDKNNIAYTVEFYKSLDELETFLDRLKGLLK
ncbi:MAG: hypothetical protein CBB97_04490 [Candidatus Endolissoclinum sp. TMED37]|nr:MAG: hypothetical protein CBB97_04490 [Candidatus Endolissoclinum sp. TMED37]